MKIMHRDQIQEKSLKQFSVAKRRDLRRRKKTKVRRKFSLVPEEYAYGLDDNNLGYGNGSWKEL